MPATYHFVTRWRIEGTPEEVYRLLDEPTELVRWWPSVYLEIRETIDEQGKAYELLTKGWLPYLLRWHFRRTEKAPFERMALMAWGDFVGRGQWTFRADGAFVDVTYDWRIDAEKPLLRYFSWIFRPLFAANHRWAMARGEESVRLELARQRAKSAEERERVPRPPGPSRVTNAHLALAMVGAMVVLGAVVWGVVLVW